MKNTANDQSPKTFPSKCAQCNLPMASPLVCDSCHALNPSAMLTDHFTLMNLPRRFDLDQRELHQVFIKLSRHSHPDHARGALPEVQELHMRVSASLNDAYRTLKDPLRRAEYLLELLGGESSAADKRVPDGFLETMMMMQEEIAHGRDTKDHDELERNARVLRTQKEGLMKRISTLFDEHQEALACEAVRKSLLGEIRGLINAVHYVSKLLDQAGAKNE